DDLSGSSAGPVGSARQDPQTGVGFRRRVGPGHPTEFRRANRSSVGGYDTASRLVGPSGVGPAVAPQVARRRGHALSQVAVSPPADRAAGLPGQWSLEAAPAGVVGERAGP